MTERDRWILDKVLLHVCSSDELENEFARIVRRETNDEVAEDEFHNWIMKFEV